METLTGVLIDVSGSMTDNTVDEIVEEGGEKWVRSMFELLENLVKYDVSSDNHIFAVGVGAKYGTCIFDVIKTIEKFQETTTEQHGQNHNDRHELRPTSNILTDTIYTRLNSYVIPKKTQKDLTNKKYDDILEEFFQVVENNGAITTREWASKQVICDAIPEDMAGLLLKALKSNDKFRRKFIGDCLPSVCKLQPEQYFFQFISNTVSTFPSATKHGVRKVVEKAANHILKENISVYSVKQASEILHGCIDAKQLNKERIKELIEIVKPLIFGETPLFDALRKTTEIFTKEIYSKHKKVLFVLSDGEPTDEGIKSFLFGREAELGKISKHLENLDVSVISCFISKCENIQSKKLFSVQNSQTEKWNNGANLLFGLSSTLQSQFLPRTLFLKRGWEIDITNNETKLFLQINHSKHIHEACTLVRNVVCCQDSLSDMLVFNSLDIYINESTTEFKAQLQEGETCYANATAAVLHLSMKRILGREGGYPDFNDLREEMIKFYGQNGANTLTVLQQISPKYRLHCKLVDAENAMKAICAKRPVVARFRLTNSEWEMFCEFYRENPTGILTKTEIDTTKRCHEEPLIGHAVVLASFNSECLRFMNSWGDNWADMGFFKVENYEVLDFAFIDVFWTLDDLFDQEKDYFKKHGSKVADELMKNLTCLQKAEYKCPICTKKSLVTEFSGSLKEAVCPKCEERFCCNNEGNILALNLYLTSLSK